MIGLGKKPKNAQSFPATQSLLTANQHISERFQVLNSNDIFSESFIYMHEKTIIFSLKNLETMINIVYKF
jgi:choline kinase